MGLSSPGAALKRTSLSECTTRYDSIFLYDSFSLPPSQGTPLSAVPLRSANAGLELRPKTARRTAAAQSRSMPSLFARIEAPKNFCAPRRALPSCHGMSTHIVVVLVVVTVALLLAVVVAAAAAVVAAVPVAVTVDVAVAAAVAVAVAVVVAVVAATGIPPIYRISDLPD